MGRNNDEPTETQEMYTTHVDSQDSTDRLPSSELLLSLCPAQFCLDRQQWRTPLPGHNICTPHCPKNKETHLLTLSSSSPSSIAKNYGDTSVNSGETDT